MRDRDQEVPAGAGAATDVETPAPAWAVPGVTGTADDDTTTARPRITAVTTTADAAEVLLGGISCSSNHVTALAQAAAALVDQDCLGGLGTGAQLADDLTVLARTVQLLAAETARRAHSADCHDVTTTGVSTTFTTAGLSKSAAWRCLHAGAFATDYPDLLAAWRAGCVNVDTLTGIAHKMRGLPAEHADAVIAFLTPLLADLNDRQVGIAAAAAVDRVRPGDADAREQLAYDQRYLASTRFRDQIMIEAKLPALEGEAFLAAVEAFADPFDKLRDRARRGRRPDQGAAERRRAGGDGRRAGCRRQDPQPQRPTRRRHRPDPPVGGRAGHQRPGTRTAAAPRSHQPDPHRQRGRVRPTTVLAHAHVRVIGTHHTLGDAAARSVPEALEGLCAAELTGAIVTTGHHPDPSPDALVAALLGAAPLQPLALGRAQRFATAAQRKALELRDRGCVIPGCGIEPRHCQAHHEPGWTQGGRTDIEDMALLCWPHHRRRLS